MAQAKNGDITIITDIIKQKRTMLKKTSSPFDIGDINRPDISVDEIVEAIHQSRRNV